MMKNLLHTTKKKLESVSPSFCLAKWLQVTVHLQNGNTHSCHHPSTHKVPLAELDADPSALHNTNTKKNLRKMMQEGERPKECDYCWRIEDSHPESFSDRILKSSNDIEDFERISALPWNESINPRHLEVSFGNECNFKCAYCGPHISSALMLEYQKFGHYKSMPEFSLENIKTIGLYPLTKDEYNPYTEAFWKWWPSVSKDLKIFRITGGEPLISIHTFKFLDSLIENPLPHLEVAINSNLGIPDSVFEKFLLKAKVIVEQKLVKKFSLFTSLDTHGRNGEFIRFGMNYDRVMKNVKKFLDYIPEAEINFMSTYNLFSVVNFDKFLHDVTELKMSYRNREGFNRVHLDTPYLKNPIFLSCYTLTPDFISFIKRDAEYLRERTVQDERQYSLYTESEYQKFERILRWVESLEENSHRDSARAELFVFLREYQKRKEIKLSDYCPEYLEFYNNCKLAYAAHL